MLVRNFILHPFDEQHESDCCLNDMVTTGIHSERIKLFSLCWVGELALAGFSLLPE